MRETFYDGKTILDEQVMGNMWRLEFNIHEHKILLLVLMDSKAKKTTEYIKY